MHLMLFISIFSIFCEILGKLFIYVLYSCCFVRETILNKNEQKVLYGITKYPNLNDNEIARILDVKLSTLSSIKKRLYEQNIYRSLRVPLLNNMGCELLAVIYTRFNPVIKLNERVKTTKSTIEVFEEIFYSVGEQDKGFSVSLSKNYTNIGRINEIRTKTFGKVGLLEDEYPNEVIFPFENSYITRFFDYSRVLKNSFQLKDDKNASQYRWFKSVRNFELSKKEKEVYIKLIKNPESSTQNIGRKVGLSRHTISRMKNKFYENDLIKNITLPNLKLLGFQIMAFYPIKFNPSKSPSKKDINKLDSDSTIFLAGKQFETVIISAYPTYQSYKEDKLSKIRYLKENDLILYTPLIGKYIFDRMIIIKDFDFASLSKKLLL